MTLVRVAVEKNIKNAAKKNEVFTVYKKTVICNIVEQITRTVSFSDKINKIKAPVNLVFHIKFRTLLLPSVFRYHGLTETV